MEFYTNAKPPCFTGAYKFEFSLSKNDIDNNLCVEKHSSYSVTEILLQIRPGQQL